MAENIEKDAANSMAGSHSAGKSKILDFVTNRFLFDTGKKRESNGNSSTNSSSGNGGGGDGATGNGWTKNDYNNYNDYLDRHYDKHYEKQNELESNRAVLDSASENAKHRRMETSRDNELIRQQSRADISKGQIDHAVNTGQVASVDLNHTTGHHKITFNNSPARVTNPGKGPGGQGKGKQQTSRPGAKRSLLTSPLASDDPRAAAGHTHVTESLTAAEIARRAKASGAAGGTTPGETAGQAAASAPSRAAVTRQSKAANSYISPSNGKRLDSAVKSQNAAARSYR